MYQGGRSTSTDTKSDCTTNIDHHTKIQRENTNGARVAAIVNLFEPQPPSTPPKTPPKRFKKENTKHYKKTLCSNCGHEIKCHHCQLPELIKADIDGEHHTISTTGPKHLFTPRYETESLNENDNQPENHTIKKEPPKTEKTSRSRKLREETVGKDITSNKQNKSNSLNSGKNGKIKKESKKSKSHPKSAPTTPSCDTRESSRKTRSEKNTPRNRKKDRFSESSSPNDRIKITYVERNLSIYNKTVSLENSSELRATSPRAQVYRYDADMLGDMIRVTSTLNGDNKSDIVCKSNASKSTPILSVKKSIPKPWDLNKSQSTTDISNDPITIKKTIKKNGENNSHEDSRNEAKYLLTIIKCAFVYKFDTKPSQHVLDKATGILNMLYQIDSRYMFMINGTFELNGRIYKPTETLVFNVYFDDHFHDSFSLFDTDAKKLKKKYLNFTKPDKGGTQVKIINGITPVLRCFESDTACADSLGFTFFNLVPHVVVRNRIERVEDIIMNPCHQAYTFRFNLDNDYPIYKTNMCNQKLYAMLKPFMSVFEMIKKNKRPEDMEILDNSEDIWADETHWEY